MPKMPFKRNPSQIFHYYFYQFEKPSVKSARLTDPNKKSTVSTVRVI